MGDSAGLGKALIFLGGLLVLAGLAVLFLPRVPWLGRLPGDIVIKRGNFSFYFPLATGILISLVLTLFLRFLGKK
jgi:hypothetical protein